ncbi:hypothetical protein [Flavobacterium rhizosphaerae]|uniref:Uncharacterized protein n=1 Tax=Flavobacterium rhizosphaerae TaxID=3163298 RepID=A0ABW8YX09_9FLAO
MAKDDKGIYTGIIGKDENGNYFCGRYMLDYKKVSTSFKEGDKITIKSAVNNPSDKSNEQYPVKSRDFVLADKKGFIK